MKKFIYVMLVALFVAVSSKAQENGKNVIKINPLGALFGSYSMSYERVVDTRSTVQFDANYGNINIFGLRINTFGVGAGYRYYFSKSKSAPEGFFVSPSVSYSNVSLSLTDTPTDRFQVGTYEGGVVAGYQWIFDSGFQIDLYLGPRFVSVSDFSIQNQTEDMDIYIQGLSGIGTKLGFSIGYCF
jgi:hypothetical protein